MDGENRLSNKHIRMKTINVVAALITDGKRVFATARGYGKALPRMDEEDLRLLLKI